MPSKIKSAAQIQHEERNRALKAEAAARRAAAREAGLAAFQANIAKMKALGEANKANRIEAHLQRNAELAYDAAVMRMMRKTANDNNARMKKAA